MMKDLVKRVGRERGKSFDGLRQEMIEYLDLLLSRIESTNELIDRFDALLSFKGLGKSSVKLLRTLSFKDFSHFHQKSISRNLLPGFIYFRF